MKKEKIIVICAHNDDQIFGVGGTIAKYASEGKKVKTIIVSFGELSHPHLKPEVITRRRVKESKESDKILGGDGVLYLGMMEKEFLDKMKSSKERKKIKKLIKNLILKEKPVKIFTHSKEDAHIMHRKVHDIVMETLKETRIKSEVYSFEVWTPIKVRGRNMPKMVVNITKTFNKKIKALKAHESQKMTLFSLLWHVYTKAILNGWHNNCKYAEIFYKIK